MHVLIMGAPYFTRAFREKGSHVISFGHRQTNDVAVTSPITSRRLLELCGEFRPDLLYYLDDGNLPLLIDPENIDFPTIFYSIDSYCNPWHIPYAASFDLTLVAQKDFIPLFREGSPDAQWLPLFCSAADGNASPETGFSKRDIPVAFVGNTGHRNNPERLPFLEGFKRNHPLFLHHGDFRPVFARSRIILNQTAFSEINFRCFEAMACGGALLMEKCGNGFDELFEPGVNILPPYPRGDYREAAAIASEWLARPEKLAAIARAGKELALSRHSDLARVNDLEGLVAPLLAGKRGAEKSKKRVSARTAFGMIAAELTRPDLEAHRRFYHELAIG